MYQILDHEADTKIRFFFSSDESLVKDCIKAFFQIVCKDCVSDETYNYTIEISKNLRREFFASDIINEFIYYMDVKELLPTELLDYSFNLKTLLKIKAIKISKVPDILNVPKAASCSTMESTNNYFDIIIDL
jgi:SHS2 domain-containing protein